MSSEKSSKKEERNCASVMIIWKKMDFHHNYGGKRGEGGSIMQEFLKTLSDNAENVSCRKVVFESHSTRLGWT